ncbi:PoNe immunity protein domain-containing protein [[Pseudomonas] boreopolis]|uniref:PoNe immunity protein domain-containing protein n=1 Tax=Xanthomonas boreopolis TaxID=86183 RepID=UPI003D4D3A99
MSLPMPDWQQWFSWKIPEASFEKRREPYLRFTVYDKRFNDKLGGIAMVTTDLPKYLGKADKGGLMTSTRRRLWDAMDWMSYQYSAGAPVSQLAEVWPYALEWAEEYGRFHEAYHQSPENKSGDRTPHVALEENEYWRAALRPVCFGLLTGHAQEMPRVMAFLDYVNAELGIHDGLLERLVAPWVPGRPIPDKATRHLPYRKLFKVFDAAPEDRPALMAKYLDEWYHASRREPYEGQHEGAGVSFYGYWSWEAAATTFVLGIDDSRYRDMPFYPRDLADYARQHAAGAAEHAAQTPGRVPAGDPVPQTGWWYTPAQIGSRRHFKQGEVFPEIEGTDYGSTFWLWSPDQTTPKLA